MQLRFLSLIDDEFSELILFDYYECYLSIDDFAC